MILRNLRRAAAGAAVFLAAGCAQLDPYNMIGRQMGNDPGIPTEVVPGPRKGALDAEERQAAFDFVWKANQQNMDLIRTRATGKKGTGSDYLFVFLMMGVLVLLLIGSILVSVYVVWAILRELFTGNI